MFSQAQIEKMVFFDIETSSLTKSTDSLPHNLKEQWVKWAEYLRGTLSEKYKDIKSISDSDLFLMKAALKAEFGRIVCISFGRIVFRSGIPTFTVAAIANEDETILLRKAGDALTKIFSTGGTLVGHNIKRFDVPYLCKRLLINKLEVPEALHLHNKKPWEVSIQDTMDIWSFGAWQEGLSSLDLICSVLGVESPKKNMRGEEVPAAFWDGKLEEISEYNMEDVIALGRIILTISSLNLFSDDSIKKNII